MKITLVALLIAVTNIAIAQNHDHHSGHGKQISNKAEWSEPRFFGHG